MGVRKVSNSKWSSRSLKFTDIGTGKSENKNHILRNYVTWYLISRKRHQLYGGDRGEGVTSPCALASPRRNVGFGKVPSGRHFIHSLAYFPWSCALAPRCPRLQIAGAAHGQLWKKWRQIPPVYKYNGSTAIICTSMRSWRPVSWVVWTGARKYGPSTQVSKMTRVFTSPKTWVMCALCHL